MCGSGPICLVRHKEGWNNIPTDMIRFALFSLVLTCATTGLAADAIVTDYDYLSPDGRFAMRMMYPEKPDDAPVKLDLVEKASGKVMVDLGTVADSQLEDAVMVWSADSKRVAYGSRDDEPGARVTSGSTRSDSSPCRHSTGRVSASQWFHSR